MKRLVFGEGLMTPSLDGSKRFTTRKYREGSHDFAKDEIVIGEFKDGLNILIRITEDTLKAPFSELERSRETAEEKGGYWFDEEYFNDLHTYYPGLTWDDIGAIISFEVLQVNGVPVVQVNEHAKYDDPE